MNHVLNTCTQFSCKRVAAVAAAAGLTVQPLLVLQPQLAVYDVQVLHRVHAVLHVCHVWVVKRAAHVVNAIHCADVGQEGVAQALALGGAPGRGKADRQGLVGSATTRTGG